MDNYVTVDRYNELSEHWEAETYGNPESFQYRNTLTPTERRIVEGWDEWFVKEKP